jgi:hypothetical protein
MDGLVPQQFLEEWLCLGSVHTFCWGALPPMLCLTLQQLGCASERKHVPPKKLRLQSQAPKIGRSLRDYLRVIQVLELEP